MIKLIGELDWDLIRLGIKEGDKIHSHTKPDKSGAIFFDIGYNGTRQTCVVWKDNYEIVQKETK